MFTLKLLIKSKDLKTRFFMEELEKNILIRRNENLINLD